MAQKLEVVITGDTKDLERALGRAGKQSEGFGKKIGSLGKVAALGAAGGIALLGKGLLSSVGAAQEAEKAQTRLEQALDSANVSYGKHGDAIDAAIQKTSRLAALDDEDLSDAFAKLVRTTGDVTKATEGMALAADIARARNISLEAATKTVEKGLMGNEAAFRKVGVEVTKGMTATQAFEKAQEQFAGSAERHGATAAGAQERFGVAIENLQEKIGAKLLPVLARLAEKGVELLAWAEANWPKLQKAIEPVMDAVKVVIDNVVDRIKAIAAAVQGVIKIVQGIRDGEWSTVWAGIKQVVVDGAFGMVTAMLALPAKILGALGKAAWAGLAKVGGWIADAIVSGLAGIGERIRDAISGAIDNVLGKIQSIIDAVQNALSWLGRLGGGAPSQPPGGRVPPGGRISGRASGGPVSAGTPYTVGEEGRELFVPGRSGTIIPNHALGGARPIELHLHVETMIGGDPSRVARDLKPHLDRLVELAI